jgi:hypothetical protein
MNPRVERLCIWSGVPMFVLFFVGFAVFARFMPPPSPSAGAQQIADMYHANTTGIRIGLIFVCLGAALLGLFYGAVCVQMKRIEGRQSPLTYAQLMLAACLIVEFIFPLFILQGAIYRPERSIDTVLAMSDTAWLMFVGVVTTGCLQFVVLAIAIPIDKREQPIFPRWLGYLNVWAALSFCVGNAIFFVKGGPLAWNGLLSWWVVISAYGIWIVATQVMLLKAVSRQEREEADVDDELDVARRFESLEAEVAALRTVRQPAGT